ncbi:hypothetical protein TREMEDRAFT_64027 [Tremella mesenterica DSM 1558]|uniref:uncharacterized protein n=1 Tax=Tremella mesenterica (strain ATCC 24925 / CBS 8224 / DSM 1558 / NBRC 9311 / NRRL Y-6157 / RJB 2259-6 / UBC 559-6) TaxID=578456 RepID=UPI0003F49EDE|nr:uncharacterized protein TREMEDRAFT_64027 [Tremella mesenterica DSM 1558]EIW68129.1 hypothetical protein TREMEDRAFT_64027 [Tremella mesenterica DSM 1558]
MTAQSKPDADNSITGNATISVPTESTSQFPSIIEQLVNFRDPHFKIDDITNQCLWIDVETSGSLIQANPRFPRTFVHSNNFIDHILPQSLRRVCQMLERAPKALSEVSYQLSTISSRAARSEGTHLWGDQHVGTLLGEIYVELFGQLSCSPDCSDVVKTMNSRIKARRWRTVLQRFVSNEYSRLVLEDDPYSDAAVKRAIIEIRSEKTVPTGVFKAIVRAVRSGRVKVDENGQAVITRRVFRKALGVKNVDNVQRLLTHMWCQMLHNRVRLALLTSHECTLVLYIDNGGIQVSDNIRLDGTSVASPCRALQPLYFAISSGDPDIFTPPSHLFQGSAVSQAVEPMNLNWACYPNYEAPTRILSFTSALAVRGSPSSFESYNDPSSPVQDEASVEQLGSPSLYTRLSPEYTIEKVREEEYSHSLLRARRWPALLHGPVPPDILQGDSLPVLRPNNRTDRFRLKNLLHPKASRYAPSRRGDERPLVFQPQAANLEEILSVGAVWDVFRLTCPPQSVPFPFPLIGKVITIECFEVETDPMQDYDQWRRGGLSQDQVRAKVKNEYRVLVEIGKLDPPIVPRIVGLWGSLQRDFQVWMMVMEDAGEEIELSPSEEDANSLAVLPSSPYTTGSTPLAIFMAMSPHGTFVVAPSLRQNHQRYD